MVGPKNKVPTFCSGLRDRLKAGKRRFPHKPVVTDSLWAAIIVIEIFEVGASYARA
jgi:hypothetical protein